jgi:hypothetical protein
MGLLNFRVALRRSRQPGEGTPGLSGMGDESLGGLFPRICSKSFSVEEISAFFTGAHLHFM